MAFPSLSSLRWKAPGALWGTGSYSHTRWSAEVPEGLYPDNREWNRYMLKGKKKWSEKTKQSSELTQIWHKFGNYHTGTLKSQDSYVKVSNGKSKQYPRKDK